MPFSRRFTELNCQLWALETGCETCLLGVHFESGMKEQSKTLRNPFSRGFRSHVCPMSLCEKSPGVDT